MTTRDDLVSRLSVDFRMMRTYDDPNGPFVRYADHATALEAKDAEIARLTVFLSNSEDQFQAKIDEVIAQMDRITSLERQLAEEPTNAMIDAGVAFALNVSLSGEYRWSQYVADLFKTMRAAAIRGGAK